MDQTSRRRDDHELRLRDWALPASENRDGDGARSRRLSCSNRSLRSHIVISSTASSPGYPLKDEIDPSTYSFSSAIRDLQTNSRNSSWESLSPDGLVLNSKWFDAERFICNPLSGEVPVECLSANSLHSRSFRHTLTNRITMSAPLVYPNPAPRHKNLLSRPRESPGSRAAQISDEEGKPEFPPSTRDVGTQSIPTEEVSSSSPSPTASTPSIMERPFKRWQTDGDDTPSEKTTSQIGDPFEGETRFSLQGHEEEEEQGKRRDKELHDGGRIGKWWPGHGSSSNNTRWRWRAGGCWLFLVKRKVTEKRPHRRKSLEWFII